ncbi:MAG: hypothetical protein NTZ23_12575 [Cyanobium sp. LacPavin_0920_WC12_MAG_63_22]|nr:hypothetical protein [Cyanobium sp. LacPavin_0920_WC12_MAG_63_22]
MTAMASSGGKTRSSLSERQMVGLFSLGLGVVLFLLILMRGQQAAHEGNQEISNDTYWVLVSPLVFSAFGVVLLRSPKAGDGARGRALEQSQRTTQSAQAALARVDEGASQQLPQARAETAAALAALESLQGEQDRTAAQAGAKIRALQAELSAAQQARVQLEANLRRDLVTQTADTSGTFAAVQLVEAQQAQRQVEKLAGTLGAQMDTARQQLAAAVQASKQAQEVVDRLEQGAPAFVAAAPTTATGSDAFLSCYREACEELGVLPGSGWQDVRATWRRKVMDWHPDQGGDSRLWVRRNAAYQLLVAWYEFNGAS